MDQATGGQGAMSMPKEVRFRCYCGHSEVLPFGSLDPPDYWRCDQCGNLLEIRRCNSAISHIRNAARMGEEVLVPPFNPDYLESV